MKYAIVKNSKIVNIIEADEVNAGIIAERLDAIAIQSDTAGINDIYADGVFSKPPALTESAIKAARQSAKSLKLKQAENAFLELVATVPGVQPGDNSYALTAKIEASEMTNSQKTSLGLKLLNAIHEVEIQGGSWYDLPETLHIME